MAEDIRNPEPIPVPLLALLAVLILTVLVYVIFPAEKRDSTKEDQARQEVVLIQLRDAKPGDFIQLTNSAILIISSTTTNDVLSLRGPDETYYEHATNLVARTKYVLLRAKLEVSGNAYQGIAAQFAQQFVAKTKP